MKLKFTPISILSILALVGLLATAIFIFIATQQLWLGLKLTSGQENGLKVIAAEGPSIKIPLGDILVKIKSNYGEIDLLPIDVTIEPDGTLHTYEIYDQFLDRQGKIALILTGKNITFTNQTNQTYIITPEKSRPFSDLPVSYWVQLLVGLFAWLISSAIFAFRPNEDSALFLLLSGGSTLTFAPFAAIYNTRELALPEMLFRWLSDGNFLGGSIFTASFIALLLCYPRRIGPKWLGHAIVGFFIFWFILQQNDVFTSMTFARRFLVMIGVFSTFFLAALHWFKTKRDPVARASLQWFLLSWMLGTSIFWFFVLMPQMFGIDTSAIMGYSFSLFLLVYGGLAVGILRYKLFALGEWWGKIMLWALTVFMLVVFDLLFLFTLQLPSRLSIGLALLLTGLLWLPLRSYVWGRFLQRQNASRNDVFEKIINIALTPRSLDHDQQWKKLLQQVFQPLHIHMTKNITTSEIDNHGLVLNIPGRGNISDYSLEYAFGGRKLFTSKDVKMSDELVYMLRHTLESRSSYEQGIFVERHRIARDIHDNIGAQLMSALHHKNLERKNTLIRETLTDLRDIINDATRKNLSFSEILADLRVETIERLSASGIAHNWMVKDEGKATTSPQIIHAVRSIVREAISNIIKHSHAKRVSIKIKRNAKLISLYIEDDGKGIDFSVQHSGNGLANIKSRMISSNGTIEFTNKHKGLKVSAEFPVTEEIAET